MPAPVKMRDTRLRPRGLTSRVARMLELMVFDGKSRNQAAEAVGLTERASQLAFKKPEVLAAYNEALKVLRSGERARNFHRLIEIRDQNENRAAAVSAARTIEELIGAEGGALAAGGVQPGIVIMINNHPVGPGSSLPAPPPALPAPATYRHALDATAEEVLWIDGEQRPS